MICEHLCTLADEKYRLWIWFAERHLCAQSLGYSFSQGIGYQVWLSPATWTKHRGCSTETLQIQPVDGIGGCAFGVPHRLPGSRRTWISGSRGLVKPRRLDGSEFCGDTAGSHHETLTCSCNYSHDCAPLGGFCCDAHSANWVLRNNSFYIMTEPIQKV